MTLILTLVSYSKVAQVSDRRLVTADGALVDDYTNKAITVPCKDACFALAYTGLAQVGPKCTETITWLTDYLWSIEAPAKELKIIALGLQKQWKSITSSTRMHPRLRSIASSLVLAGYYRVRQEPFAIRISDKRPDCLFKLKPYLKRKNACAILVDGEERGIDGAIGRRIKRQKRRRVFQTATKQGVARELVSIVRAARRTPYGGSVSPNCLAIVITPKLDQPGFFEIWSDYHGQDNRDWFGPYHTHFTGPWR